MDRDDDVVLLGHGGGGQLTRQLLAECLLPPLLNPVLARLDDGACITVPEPDLVLTTDSYVVDPLFFPGGNIGTLAACGTINDLAMQGAEPRYLTLGLIIEEGLPKRDLRLIIESLAAVVREVGASVVTGDTKVVERGRGSGLYINTAGLGVRRPGTDVYVGNARPGDVVLLSGSIGDHGVAVMSRRQGLGFESDLQSDVAPLWGMVRELLDTCPGLHCLRDPTRGGVTAALCDVAETAGVGIRIRERALTVKPAVRGACDLLGLDPLNVANEGKALVICSPGDADRALAALRRHPLGRDAAVIGRVVDQPRGLVLLQTRIGGERILTPPVGEDLPRIC